MTKTKTVIKVSTIQQRILLIRGEKVIVDADLAEAYGVTTKALNQAIRRKPIGFLRISCFALPKRKRQRW